LREERNQLHAHWMLEKETIQQIRATKKEIDQLRIEMEQAERQGDLNRVKSSVAGRAFR